MSLLVFSLFTSWDFACGFLSVCDGLLPNSISLFAESSPYSPSLFFSPMSCLPSWIGCLLPSLWLLSPDIWSLYCWESPSLDSCPLLPIADSLLLSWLSFLLDNPLRLNLSSCDIFSWPDSFSSDESLISSIWLCEPFGCPSELKELFSPSWFPCGVSFKPSSAFSWWWFLLSLPLDVWLLSSKPFSSDSSLDTSSVSLVWDLLPLPCDKSFSWWFCSPLLLCDTPFPWEFCSPSPWLNWLSLEPSISSDISLSDKSPSPPLLFCVLDWCPSLSVLSKSSSTNSSTKSSISFSPTPSLCLFLFPSFVCCELFLFLLSCALWLAVGSSALFQLTLSLSSALFPEPSLEPSCVSDLSSFLELAISSGSK